jgi:hypothetical protein
MPPNPYAYRVSGVAGWTQYLSCGYFGGLIKSQYHTFMEQTKMLKITGGELRDNPGWWKIDGQVEGEAEKWSFVRKPDGSIWDCRPQFRRPPGLTIA